MAPDKRANIIHKNNLSGYIGNWLTMMNHLKKTQPPIRIPRVVVSYNDNMYDLSLMLSYLDNNMTILEETPLTPDTLSCSWQHRCCAESWFDVRVGGVR